MAAERSVRPPIRGCLPFVLGTVGVMGVILVWIVWGMGGIEGFERDVLTKGAVTGVEGHLVLHRPDGVSDEEIHVVFERVREAVSDDRVDREALYRALDGYQEVFKGTRKRPSDGEVRSFLTDLEMCIRDEATPEQPPRRGPL